MILKICYECGSRNLCEVSDAEWDDDGWLAVEECVDCGEVYYKSSFFEDFQTLPSSSP